MWGTFILYSRDMCHLVQNNCYTCGNVHPIISRPCSVSPQERATAAITTHEPQDIESQHSLFSRWNDDRQQRLDAEIDRIRKLQMKTSIEQRLRDMKAREERLRFFEQEDKIHLSISQLPRMRPIEDVKEEEQFVGTPAERGKQF